jgi:hypothetical protein
MSTNHKSSNKQLVLGSLWNTGYEKHRNRKNIGIGMVCFCNPIGIENIGIEMRSPLAAS